MTIKYASFFWCIEGKNVDHQKTGSADPACHWKNPPDKGIEI